MSISNLPTSFIEQVDTGDFAATGTVAVNYAFAGMDDTCVVVISPQTTAGATNANQPAISSITPGTGFSVVCGGANTESYSVCVFK